MPDYGVMLLLVATSWLEYAASCGELEYSVVIDVGSSGSRSRCYKWPKRKHQNEVPTITEYFSYKQKPGFSTVATDEIDSYVLELIKKSKENVPRGCHGVSDIYFLATAGMRLLREDEAHQRMQAADDVLRNSSLNPFRYNSLNTRILSGEEEGAFAWIALNYLKGYFTQETSQSVGIMELGGASTQISFLPDVSPLAGKFPVQIAGVTYPLYVHSYLHYGQEFAFRWTLDHLVKEQITHEAIIDHPCMLPGDNKTEVVNGEEYKFIGIGNASSCYHLMDTLIYTANPARCYPRPCAVGPVYQPSIPESMYFHAMAAFNYPVDAYEINTSIISPQEILDSAHVYCNMTLAEAALIVVNQDEEFLSANCQDGIFTFILFTKAYGFAGDSDKIYFTDEIKKQHINWGLGSVLYETYKEVYTCNGMFYKPTMTNILFIMVILKLINLS